MVSFWSNKRYWQKLVRERIETLKFIANVIVPQAARSREGGAAQHGRRRLSDVTGDDGQSQSGAGGGPGAGGRELIRRPRVTRIPFLADRVPAPSRTVSLTQTSRKTTNHPTVQTNTADSPSVSITTGTIYWACIRMETGPKELFVAALWDPQTRQAWVVRLKKEKWTLRDLFH